MSADEIAQFMIIFDSRMERYHYSMVLSTIRITMPLEIKGDAKLSELIFALTGRQISSTGIKNRITRKTYIEGIHFRVVGGKMRLWNREAIIEFEKEKMMKDGYEVD